MVDVPSRRKGDCESVAGEIHFPGPGRVNDYGRSYRYRLETVYFSDGSRRRGLLFPVQIFQLLPEDAAPLACVPGYVFFLAKVPCDI